MAGGVVIARPGFDTFRPEYLAVLGAAICWGGAACLVRTAAQTEHPMTIALWTTLLIATFSFAPAATVWRWPTATDFYILAGIGILSALAMVAWTTALRYGDAAQVTVTDVVQIFLGVMLGMLLGELPSLTALAGMALIGFSVFLVTADAAKH